MFLDRNGGKYRLSHLMVKTCIHIYVHKHIHTCILFDRAKKKMVEGMRPGAYMHAYTHTHTHFIGPGEEENGRMYAYTQTHSLI